MTISLRIGNEEATLIKKYAEINNMTVSDFLRAVALERIENEIDLKAYNEAMKAYEKDSTTYSHEEVKQMLGLK